MKKRVKKENRLSPKARELIEYARVRLSTQPQKAIEYLQSIPAQQLNLYDRQKVGREILARYDAIKKITWLTSVEENDEGRAFLSLAGGIIPSGRTTYFQMEITG